MSADILAPVEFMEAVATLRLPPTADARLQELMDRNNEGVLNESEKEELRALVEWCEEVALIRMEAFRLVNKN